ncbi:MAG: beta strand repeat-containing protein [Candidatus Spyradenecus sp.]
MRRFTRLALAALAAIGASGALVAAPAASWTSFGDGITNGGTTKYYGGNTAYYITVSGGTRADDGSYIQVGAPASEDGATAATAGSITLTVPSAVLTSKTITIMAEVQYLSAEANTLIDLVVGSTAVRLKSTGTQLQQCWGDATGYGSFDWTPTDRQRVTFTYQGANNQGSHTYLGDTPTAAAMSATNLMTRDSNIGTITLGKAATGLKIYSLYVYTTKLASASAVTTEIASNKAALAVPLSFTFSRAGLTADGNTMEVLQVGGGAAKGSTFEAELGTNATRKTDGGGETDSSTFFKKETATSPSSLLTTNGYPMIACKFVTNADSQRVDEGWSVYLPFTPSVAATVTRVCPQLFAVTSGGATQGDANKVFNYTVTLYEGTVNATTESPTALATAAGTTGSLNQILVNTQAADFTDKVTLNTDTTYTMKLAVSASETGGGSYSGIGGVIFSSVIGRTVSGEGTWSAGWTAGSAPADDSIVELTVSDAATLSMDAAASLSSLTVLDGSSDGSASLTFSGEQSLTSAATTLNVDTDVSAITSSLGAVTLASGKTLTAKSAADFSSITAGSGATVKYIAPSGSIAKVDNATVELAATAETSGITLPSAGGTYKVSSGTYTGMTLTFTGTATNYAFTGGDMTFNDEFSFGTATVNISGGTTIRAPKMVTVQGGGSRPTSVTQTGGDIILSGSGDGGSTQNATVMFGHWPSATSTYNLSAGSIKAEKGGMRFGNDSPSTLNLSGTGLLKVKGIWGKGTTDCALNLSGGTLSIGSDGFKSIDRLTVTATGGELNAFASNTIAQAITLNGPTTFSANADCEMTVQGTLSGSGTLVKSGAGTLSLTGTVSTPVELAEGTLNLGTRRPAVTVTGEGTTLKLTLTPDEALTGRAALAPTLGDGVTSYALEVSFCGTVKNATVSASGEVTFPAYEATSTGNSWWWDYEFNGNVSNSGSDGTGLTQDGAAPVYDNGTALKLKSTPYRSVTYPDEFTAVMYAKAGTTPYGGLLAFGTKDNGAISLVCGAKPANGQVRLIYSVRETVTELISAEAMSVPNATTANHLYAFTKRTEGGNTVIDVYLDGRKLAHYVFSGAATIGGGFQVGSLHGGEINGAIKKPSDDNGTVDFLRVSNTALSDAAIAALAAAYPYTSPKGKATRTVTGADTAWSADGAWTEGETTVAAPTAGKVVELTANENASLAVALEADVSYESLKLSGTGTVALTRGEGTTGRVVVQGVTTVETDSTVDARAVKLTGLTIAEGKTLTIDCSGLELLQETYLLTGYVDEATYARISVTLPSAEADTPFTFEATRDSTGSVVLRVTAVKDLSATVSADTAWASVLWTWEGHETPTALQATTLGNATLTFENNAAISTPAALTVTGTLTASGAGSLDLPTGSTVATTQLSGSATLILHQSQANVVTTRSGTGGTFKFVGGTTAAPLVVPYDVDFPGAIAIAANSCVKLNRTISGNASYQVTGEGQSSIAIIANTAGGWGVLNTTGSVTSLFRNLTLSLGGSNDFWFRAGLTDNVWLDIQSGRTLKQQADAPNTNVGGVLTVRNLTGGGIFNSLNANQTLRLLNTDAAASTFNAAPTINDGGSNFKLVFAGNWTVSAALTDAKTPPIIHIGDGSTATTVETAFAFAPGPAYTVQANATLRPTAAAAALPASLTLAEGGKVQLTLNTLTLPSALAGTGTVLFGNGTDTFAYTLAAAPANFTGTYNVAANSTLTLTSAPNGSAGFAGSGTLVIGNGTAATNVTSTKAYPDATQPLTVQVKSPSTLTLNPGSGNFAFPNAVAFDVASGAKLVLASGMSFFGVSGEGSCSVTGNYVFGVSGTAASDGFPDAAKVLDVATLTVGTPTNTAVTLGIRPFGAIDIAPTTLKVNKNAEIARDGNTNATATASVSIGATATVTGEGTIGLPVAFTEGATLDTVTAAPLLLKGKVTGTIKVKLDTAKAVLTTTSDAELDRNTQLAFASDKTSQTFVAGNYRFAETHLLSIYTFSVLPPLELPAGLPEAVTGNEAAQNAIYDAVAAAKGFGTEISSVTAVKAQSTGGAAGSTEALALFENLYAVATPADEPLPGGTYEGTVTVYYDFGISQLHVKSASLVNAEEAQLYVLLCAKVATTQNTTTANYASGTIVSLYRGTEALSAVEPNDAQLTALGITPAAGEKWFAVPMAELNSGTNAFKVKASQTTPAAN